MHNKISVIIPVYNVEKYIAKCLDTVMTQTYRNLEIIIVDDGSTDGSGVICDYYALRDERIIVFHKENGGVSSARNVGLINSTGDWVGFVDPDDWLEPDAFEVLLLNALKYTVDISVCNYRITHNREGKLYDNSIVNTYIYDYQESMYQLLNGTGRYFCALWNKLIKREIINDVLFDCELSNAEDLLFLFNIYKHNKPRSVYCESVKYNYYVRNDSAANSNVFKICMIKELDVWKTIYNVSKVEESYIKVVNMALYMCKMTLCRLLLKASLLESLEGRKVFCELKNDNKDFLNYNGLKNILDVFKMTIIMLPYDLCGVFWKRLLFLKDIVRKNLDHE